MKECDFKELKILFLQNNNISQLKVLEKVNFVKLNKWALNNNNNITDIKILENVNF